MSEWAKQMGLPWLNPNAVTKETPKFLWVDCETTGLDIHTDVLLEVGAVLTDAEGYVCSEPVSFLVNGYGITERYDAAVQNMSDLVLKMHTDSGLMDEDWRHESFYLEQVFDVLSGYLDKHCENPKSIRMAGSSIKFDYYMLWEFMPGLIDMLNYRVIDSSSIKELCREFTPDLYAHMEATLKPKKLHRVLPDLADSLHEYGFYLSEFLHL